MRQNTTGQCIRWAPMCTTETGSSSQTYLSGPSVHTSRRATSGEERRRRRRRCQGCRCMRASYGASAGGRWAGGAAGRGLEPPRCHKVVKRSSRCQVACCLPAAEPAGAAGDSGTRARCTGAHRQAPAGQGCTDTCLTRCRYCSRCRWRSKALRCQRPPPRPAPAARRRCGAGAAQPASLRRAGAAARRHLRHQPCLRSHFLCPHRSPAAATGTPLCCCRRRRSCCSACQRCGRLQALGPTADLPPPAT